MMFGYVIGLPVLAFLRVRNLKRQLNKRRDIRRRTFGYEKDEKEEGLEVFPEHKIYGPFYSAFREDTWWWEGTVAARKIVIAMIGVFGAEMESMQVHFTIMLVVLIILATSQVRPFGGNSNGLLHRLEMFSLMATFLTLWAGSVFNTLPRCEDPDNVGEQMLWCDAMSVMVGTIDIMVVVAFVFCFVYLKMTTTDSSSDADKGNDAAVGFVVLEMVPPKINEEVMTAFGEGRVMSRRKDGVDVIELTNWRLAGESKVRVYQASSVLGTMKRQEAAEEKGKM
jgi:hypothetical protein